jgi:ribulose-5-phosphate 4-epimerase/fuculose-1-phosphate aldolase
MHPDEWQAACNSPPATGSSTCWAGRDHLQPHHDPLAESVSGGEKQFLINPFGLHYSEVTASNLLKIDLEGHQAGRQPWPVNPAGFTVHSAIHENIADAHCVMHTHTTAGLAVGMHAGRAWRRTTSIRLSCTGLVAYHDFEGITSMPMRRPPA